MNEKVIKEVISSLESLKEDAMVIKRVKEKINEVILLLQQDFALNFDKALRELEGLDSSDIPAYDRTQLWDIISRFESFSSLTRI